MLVVNAQSLNWIRNCKLRQNYKMESENIHAWILMAAIRKQPT